MHVARIVLLLALLPSPVLAVDGIREINQACAIQTGCLPGDAPGYPVTIGSAGSYRLTSNLNYSGPTNPAIDVMGIDANVDLNGFTIQGDNTCSTEGGAWVATCTSPSGIPAIRGTHRNKVSNGRIVGASGDGVALGDASEVTDVQVVDCAGIGIRTGSRSIVASSSSTSNREHGISVGIGSLVRSSVVANNGGHGLSGAAATLIGNVARQNGLSGISAADGSTIADNSASQNGGSGITATTGSGVHRNTAHGNDGFGLLLGGVGYRENVISANLAGTVSGGINLGSNACNGNTTCP